MARPKVTEKMTRPRAAHERPATSKHELFLQDFNNAAKIESISKQIFVDIVSFSMSLDHESITTLFSYDGVVRCFDPLEVIRHALIRFDLYPYACLSVFVMSGLSFCFGAQRAHTRTQLVHTLYTFHAFLH